MSRQRSSSSPAQAPRPEPIQGMTDSTPEEATATPGVPERARSTRSVRKEPSHPPRVMSIHAHPDDQEFSVGGTLAKWAHAGSEIISVIITSGDSGSNDPAKDGSHKQELADLREKEQLAANAILGVRETIFLRYPDGELEPTIALRKDLTRLIRR